MTYDSSFSMICGDTSKGEKSDHVDERRGGNKENNCRIPIVFICVISFPRKVPESFLAAVDLWREFFEEYQTTLLLLSEKITMILIIVFLSPS